jgi:branched-chain amino acid transport system permease protein
VQGQHPAGDDETVAGRRSGARSRFGRAGIRAACLVAVFALVVTTPVWASPGVARVVVDVLVLVAVAQLWSYLVASAGIVALGVHGFAGLGAYGLWFLGDRYGTNPVVAVAAVGCVAVAVAALVAPLVLRATPAMAAVLTLTVGQLLVEVVTRVRQLGGNAPARSIETVVELGSSRDGLVSWLAVVLGVGAMVLAWGHRRSRLGLALVAQNDDPEVAGGLDLPVARARCTLWLAAAGAAGMAGAVVHFRTGVVTPAAFDPARWTFPLVAVAGIGGLKPIEGPAIGAIVYVVADEVVQGHQVGFALVMALVGAAGLVVGPDGWWGWVRQQLPVEPFPVRRRFRG